MSASGEIEPGEFGIWHFPQLEELETFLQDLANAAIQSLTAEEHQHAETIELMEPDRIIVRNEWGRGTATPGDDMLRIIYFFNVRGVDDPHLDAGTNFEFAARAVTQRMISIINEGVAEPPGQALEWFNGIDIQPAPIDIFPDQVNLALGRAEGNRVFDLARAEAIEFREGVDLQNLPRIPLEELRTEHLEPEEPEEEPEVEEPEEETEEDEEPEEEVIPGVPDELQTWAVDEDTLEVPVGKKDTKTVQPREPYDFEIIMATNRPRPQELPYEADVSLQGDVMGEIGDAVRGNMFDPTRSGGEAPGTYPRTGVYIRNYLKFRGPAYSLQMHKDLLIYTQFVNATWDYNLRAGKYDSFREFIYILQQIPERGQGPELIRPLTQEQASARGLETVPDHPSVEGEKAPWLQRRQYYQLVEENENHDAWRNPYDYLHGRIDE